MKTIHEWLKFFGVTNYKLNSDGTIDVYEDVIIYKKGLKSLEEIPIKFRNIYGSFVFDKNPIKNLIGSPKYVEKDFECFECELTSLKGGPEYVGKMFECYRNSLSSLEGGPKFVGTQYVCFDNQLKTLLGSPKEVEFFDCSYNDLDNLMFAPKTRKSFRCRYNNLKSLKGLRSVGKHLDLVGNLSIKLEPKYTKRVHGKVITKKGEVSEILW
jgi:hypothetical protein